MEGISLTNDTVILMNFGMLITLAGILCKVVWVWAKHDSAIDQLRSDLTKENRLREKDIDAAHNAIREIRNGSKKD